MYTEMGGAKYLVAIGGFLSINKLTGSSHFSWCLEGSLVAAGWSTLDNLRIITCKQGVAKSCIVSREVFLTLQYLNSGEWLYI